MMSGKLLRSMLALVLVAMAASCSKPKPATWSLPEGDAPAISGLPVTVTLKQRSAAEIPGAEEKLLVSVEDISGGKTWVSLSRASGGRYLLDRVPMKTGDAKKFEYGGQYFELRLDRIDDALIGEDFAALTVSTSSPPPKPGELSEGDKIERLIGSIEGLGDAKFRRNNKDYPAQEAASHLRRKLEAADGKISTAEQFITELASKSSMSGEEYEIRFPDGKVVKTADFLRGELEKMKMEKKAD